ncbi:hypothetical protein EJ05DRAFT_503417 [Pseudovirgaria hyperparasitica]|uniref:Uncharacterized protein n=1 Tax=Pseudovirgaria hyperparasitica TaxID=470096 RepID=A0A6A6VZ29_9PEZI|nr:uncharacterized protein EJ05DRAFT_503417 [Pseudovirgaria hyperparasitica]KAF2755106.1 hypothetical protein EJ05DRAFT_503417 [Pseudovirgaria hyperparasitica]
MSVIVTVSVSVTTITTTATVIVVIVPNHHKSPQASQRRSRTMVNSETAAREACAVSLCFVGTSLNHAHGHLGSLPLVTLTWASHSLHLPLPKEKAMSCSIQPTQKVRIKNIVHLLHSRPAAVIAPEPASARYFSHSALLHLLHFQSAIATVCSTAPH